MYSAQVDKIPWNLVTREYRFLILPTQINTLLPEYYKNQRIYVHNAIQHNSGI